MNEIKNIFNKKLLNKNIEISDFSNLTEKSFVIKKWIDLTDKGILDRTKEIALQSDFLNDFFVKILGYKTRLDNSEEWTLDKEIKAQTDETRSDGALGFFSSGLSEVKVVIELKDGKTNLDARQHRLNDRRTPVEQAFSYSSKSGKNCNWVILSNYREIRLYNSKDSGEYELFLIEKLADENELKKFLFLMSAENLISKNKESLIDALYRKNQDSEKEITEKFYMDYKKFRLNLFNHIKSNNTGINELLMFEKTQKLLDRFIFICFCEDTGLLEERTIRKLVARAKESYDLSEYTIWEEMRKLFRAINNGNPNRNVNRFNSGLFADDSAVDNLKIGNKIFEELALISDYDFASDLNVNILGHIFEQSLNDIEEIKSQIAGGVFDEKTGKRKKDGIFYTPEYITGYIIDQSIGGWLEECKKELGFYELPELETADYRPDKKGQYSENAKRHIEFWDKYREKLSGIKVLDPACGSGAFLNQAFDYLYEEGQRVNIEIAKFNQGQFSLFGLDRNILKNNIFGVDLNNESVEITKLSLWLKTARKTDPLTSLDDNIKCGNSLIDDPEFAGEKAFSWGEKFNEIISSGGFDVVIGNPPYVRQELIKDIKPYLEKNYKVYTGVSDLFVYFFEKGLNLLKNDGVFSFIVSNKFIKASYGKTLTGYLQKNYTLSELIDFGDVQIFDGATTYPCIINIKNSKPRDIQKFRYLKLTSKEETIDFSGTIKEKSILFELRNDAESWIFENPLKNAILEKIKKAGKTLDEFIESKIYRGIVTGLTEAFVIDNETKLRLCAEDAASIEIIKPFLMGRNIGKYYYNWDNQWLISAYSGLTKKQMNMTKSANTTIEDAEDFFSKKYPAVYKHLKSIGDKIKSGEIKVKGKGLYNREDQGDYWWELRPCAYYEEFEKPKIIYQTFQVKPAFTYDKNFMYCNNAVWIIVFDSKYLLGVLNSKIGWFLISNYCTEIQNGYQLIYDYLKNIPIAEPDAETEKTISEKVDRTLELNKEIIDITKKFLNYIKDKYKPQKISGKLEEFYSLEFSEFLKELKKQKVTIQGIEEYSLKEIFDSERGKISFLKNESAAIDRDIDNLVNKAYGLSDDEFRAIFN